MGKPVGAVVNNPITASQLEQEMAEINAASRQNNAVHNGAVVNQQKDNTPYLLTDPANIN